MALPIKSLVSILVGTQVNVFAASLEPIILILKLSSLLTYATVSFLINSLFKVINLRADS